MSFLVKYHLRLPYALQESIMTHCEFYLRLNENDLPCMDLLIITRKMHYCLSYSLF